MLQSATSLISDINPSIAACLSNGSRRHGCRKSRHSMSDSPACCNLEIGV
jgi:hypothetical protein